LSYKTSRRAVIECALVPWLSYTTLAAPKCDDTIDPHEEGVFSFRSARTDRLTS
jgi:hypothetical protein